LSLLMHDIAGEIKQVHDYLNALRGLL
jgi:hypothetical protein